MSSRGTLLREVGEAESSGGEALVKARGKGALFSITPLFFVTSFSGTSLNGGVSFCRSGVFRETSYLARGYPLLRLLRCVCFVQSANHRVEYACSTRYDMLYLQEVAFIPNLGEGEGELS